MTAPEVSEFRARYRPSDVLAADPELAHVVESIRRGRFSPGDSTLFEPLVRTLVETDPFFVLADFRASSSVSAVSRGRGRIPTIGRAPPF